MYPPGWSRRVGCLFILLLHVLGCESSLQDARQQAANPQGRRAQAVASARLAAEDAAAATRPSGDVPVRMVAPVTTQRAAALVYDQVPDPEDIPHSLADQLARALQKIDRNDRLDSETKATQKEEKTKDYEAALPRTLKRLRTIRHPREARLTLDDVIRRTLANNYAIAAQSYNPAIESARVVEAEAMFDEVYFINFNNNKQDRPSASELESNNSQTRTVETGIRKILSTGMQVQVSYALNRSETDLVFQTFNPTYFNNFVVQFQQPLLRGFGLDYNRAQIELTKIDREMSIERLRKDVREILSQATQYYWQLVQYRREVGQLSRLLPEFEIILDDLEARLKAGYDIYSVQLDFTRSRLLRREVEFVEACAKVGDFEDKLKQLMNDPEIGLAKNVGIIPVDVPSTEPIVLDQIAEASEGLSNREELHEAKLAIEKAQLGVGVAKNQALPKLDLLFRYVVDGLGTNADRAFSQLSENDFHEYVVGLQFEWPIGNRGPEAKIRQARLQQAQAIAAHRQVIEQVITDVQEAVRWIETELNKAPHFRQWVTAASSWVEVTKARKERKDWNYLQLELDAHDTLAEARRQMLGTVVQYNLALVNLERQKGTLLEYNNIVIRGSENPKQMTPYRPALGGALAN